MCSFNWMLQPLIHEFKKIKRGEFYLKYNLWMHVLIMLNKSTKLQIYSTRQTTYAMWIFTLMHAVNDSWSALGEIFRKMSNKSGHARLIKLMIIHQDDKHNCHFKLSLSVLCTSASSFIYYPGVFLPFSLTQSNFFCCLI
jgi:hypothetical protein